MPYASFVGGRGIKPGGDVLMVPVRVASATDVGRVREVNEDSSFTGSELFAVADGMGGHAGGHAASAIAVAHLEKLAQRTE